MKKLYSITLLLLSIILIGSCSPQVSDEPTERPEFAIVIHGGAGNANPDRFTDERQKEYRDKLEEVINAGIEVLKNGGTSLEAVETTIRMMEDCPLFNAGKGAVFTNAGTNEMDASVMDGRDLNAGAVAGVGDIKNPITAAIKVMTDSKHVLLGGAGASIFATEQGLEIVDSSYFYTEDRWKSLQRALDSEKHGTVGCAALDKYGNLAAGTSTGGMTNKMYGRIGDSPIVGAGTYANNKTCAVSGTGHGEFFIRYTVAHDISALMEYKGLTLQQAADKVVLNKLVAAEGSGGIIAVDKDGNIAMVTNTNMMFRAFAKSTGEKEIGIFVEE